MKIRKPFRLFAFVFFLFTIYLNLFYREDVQQSPNGKRMYFLQSKKTDKCYTMIIEEETTRGWAKEA